MAVHRAAPRGPGMTRRRFLGSALAGGAATIAPFAFVRAIAAPARFESFVREQMREAQTPGIAVSPFEATRSPGRSARGGQIGRTTSA